MHWINGSTVGSGGAANVTFTSIPQTFTHLQVRISGRGGNTSFSQGLSAYVQVNGDGTSANYYNHATFGEGASANPTFSLSAGTLSLQQVLADTSATAGIFGSAVFDILDYTSNKRKVCKVVGGWDKNGAGRAAVGSGVWIVTDAITQVLVATDGTLGEGTRVDLYGITSNPIATGA
jgi:hypothetical protein